MSFEIYQNGIATNSDEINGDAPMESAEWTKFSPQEYLEAYFTTPEGNPLEEDYMPFIYRTLVKLARQVPPGHRMLDFGCGPCIFCAIPFCRLHDEVAFADYLQENLDAIQDWLFDKPGAFNWDIIINHIAKLSGDCFGYDLKEQIRQKAIGTFRCDIYSDNEILDGIAPGFDLVTTSLCLEGISKSKEELFKNIKTLGTIVKPGGYAIQIAALEKSYCNFNGVFYYVFPATKNNFLDGWTEAGFKIIQIEVQYFTAKEKNMGDYKGLIGVLAQKQ